ncbi:hypothetical protein M0R89_18995 (plasmid) [Halorussus limi]|uniref:MobA/VirD2-like nuclease domain-containing protein n=1 Tax=Halorussus limi TaxID=2938695 RepID=A0A8U0I156_9EURY|nr:hypothetical protein [Halorussus limi]UPV76621.1 hypothetical protein M0R89_18995 [Halorussus limi]
MRVFTDTNYREHGARDLVEYLDKEQGLENRFGEQMTEEEVTAFIEKSEEYEFEREIILSPSNGSELSDEQLSLHTRQVMSEFCEGRNTATYCYAIHRDTDHPHTQVAVTGTKRDLWMDVEDCEDLRECATEHFHDHHRELTNELGEQFETELLQEADLAMDTELHPDQDHDQDWNQDADHADEQQQGQAQEQGQDRGQAQSPGVDRERTRGPES